MKNIATLDKTFTFVVDRVTNLVEKYPTVRNLKINSSSEMGYKLSKYGNTDRYLGYLILKENIPVAWAWTYHSIREYGAKYGINTGRAIHFYVYTNPDYRRKGLGKFLYQCGKDEAAKKHRKLIVYPWDDVSCDFYNKVHYPDNKPLPVGLKWW